MWCTENFEIAAAQFKENQSNLQNQVLETVGTVGALLEDMSSQANRCDSIESRLEDNTESTRHMIAEATAANKEQLRQIRDGLAGNVSRMEVRTESIDSLLVEMANDKRDADASTDVLLTTLKDSLVTVSSRQEDNIVETRTMMSKMEIATNTMASKLQVLESHDCERKQHLGGMETSLQHVQNSLDVLSAATDARIISFRAEMEETVELTCSALDEHWADMISQQSVKISDLEAAIVTSIDTVSSNLKEQWADALGAHGRQLNAANSQVAESVSAKLSKLQAAIDERVASLDGRCNQFAVQFESLNATVSSSVARIKETQVETIELHNMKVLSLQNSMAEQASATNALTAQLTDDQNERVAELEMVVNRSTEAAAKNGQQLNLFAEISTAHSLQIKEHQVAVARNFSDLTTRIGRQSSDLINLVENMRDSTRTNVQDLEKSIKDTHENQAAQSLAMERINSETSSKFEGFQSRLEVSCARLDAAMQTTLQALEVQRDALTEQLAQYADEQDRRIAAIETSVDATGNQLQDQLLAGIETAIDASGNQFQDQFQLAGMSTRADLLRVEAQVRDVGDAADNRSTQLEARMAANSESDRIRVAELAVSLSSKLDTHAVILADLESTVNTNVAAAQSTNIKLKAVASDMALGIHQTQQNMNAMNANSSARMDELDTSTNKIVNSHASLRESLRMSVENVDAVLGTVLSQTITDQHERA